MAAVPVFEEFEPAPDCGCAGCAHRRRALAAGEHPAAHGCRKALAVVTAAGVALGATVTSAAAVGAAPASPRTGGTAVEPGPPPTEQGGTAPLHGSADMPATAEAPLRAVTRAEIINRAKRWVNAKVPYSMTKYWSDGYRQDCSGYVSMAWNLAKNEWTGSLAQFGDRIMREDLQAGDILLFHNPADPTGGSHVTIFGGWTDYTHTYYTAYEQTKPHTRRQATPMAYWNHSASYVAYRYKGLVTGNGTGTGGRTGTGGGESEAVPFPGTADFGPGTNNASATRLREMLVARGGKRFYRQGPGPQWTDADRRATEAFQRAQGWRGKEADGLPGPHTWRLLVNKQGRNIPAAQPLAPQAPSTRAPAFPGREHFRPGRSNAYVTQLGERLVERGYGKHYTQGPGPLWREADRLGVQAFQRAQGWRGAAADGYPGPETWRRLFS
ncbi:peptidoglycan-binding protein [Streptomyces peucetius]|uniref:Peptidoglycan-binding protein n=1 Tax=Streptomyces peucetius TaxID=1950 RepID=A0ABY6I5U3_STRPE|nr:peptidoglycan-binding protein [Streptomyces peucetius]UYQ62288.1 peptidoglycan-binding protein [Streptomyces peucetius]